MDEYKIENLRFEVREAFKRLSDAESNLANHGWLLDKLKAKLEKTDPTSLRYCKILHEYNDAKDDQQNLVCHVKYLKKEADSLLAELKKYDDRK